MSWWREREPPRPPGLLNRLRPGTDEPPPPAALLRLPPILTSRPAGSFVTLPPAAAISLDQRSRGFHAGASSHQLGYVLLWQAKSVDLRGVFLKLLTPFTEAQLAEENETDAESGLTGRTGQEHENLALRLAALLVPPPESLLRAHGPLEWPARFFPYQLDGIRTLIHSSHLLLGDEMGLGKTIQTIAALRILLHAREIEQALIVTPASVLEQWRREISLWAPELRVITITGPAHQRAWQWQYRAHLTLVSYDTLRSDFSASAKSGPRRTNWGLLALDEAQKIKNPATDVSRICKRLPRRRSWALTGTPLENSTEDVVSILEFVAGGGDPSPVPATRVSLRSSLGAFQLRRRKADVLRDLPPKILTKLLLPLSPAQRAAYDRAEQEGLVFLRSGEEIPIESVLALIHRLKQICNFAPAASPDIPGTSAKMEDLAGRLEELAAAGQKALVFTQYTNEATGARQIAARLERFGPLVYTGDLVLRRRSEVVDRFRDSDRHRVLILSLILNSKVELFDEVVDGATLDPARLLTREDLIRLIGV
ncbi:MAG: DEAD/DEAH box helicase [Chloroflexi bacterium]|nr:DEAD/DEAH box helicase [Chloroflexota bacterium]